MKRFARLLAPRLYPLACDLLILAATVSFVVALGYVDYFAWEIYR